MVDLRVEADQAGRVDPGEKYLTFKYYAVITIAHEICHFFKGYLSGYGRPTTPPEVGVGRYNDEGRGESGRYWEMLMLGGIPQLWSAPKTQKDTQQCGLPYLAVPKEDDDDLYFVPIDVVVRFARGSKCLSQSVRTRLSNSPTDETHSLHAAARGHQGAAQYNQISTME